METTTSGEEKLEKNPLEKLIPGDLILALRPGYVWHWDPQARQGSRTTTFGRIDTSQPAHPIPSGDVLMVLKEPFWDSEYSESMLQIHVLHGEVPYVLRVSRRMLALGGDELHFRKLSSAND